MKPLPINPMSKLSAHIDALFGNGVSQALEADKTSFDFSRRTGRIKNFSIANRLVGTFRTDGGIAITIYGASMLTQSTQFRENCIKASEEATPFVSEGRSLFCKHVIWCGSNVKTGSDVVVLDSKSDIIAVGVALMSAKAMMAYKKGVAVRIREGIKGRTDITRTST